MALFKKQSEKFEPNCELDPQTGVYHCEPVMEIDGKVLSAKQPVVVKFDENLNKFVIQRAKGVDAKLIKRLLEHLESNKV